MRTVSCAAVTIIAAVHCSGASSTGAATDGGASSDGTAGPTMAHTPARHRASAAACTDPRPPSGTTASLPGGACQVDADCTNGKNGRCVHGPTLATICSYDECATDADCSHGVCSCRNEGHYRANVCFRGNCVIDADCGGGYCSPSATLLQSNCVSNVPPGSFGYFCHTAADACVDDADCPDSGSCVFFADEARWKCLERRCSS